MNAKRMQRVRVWLGEMALAIVILALGCGFLAVVAGCATTKADFQADITTSYAEDGSVAAVQDKTRFLQRNGVTWGSKLTAGAGEMAYNWDPDGKGSIAVGNAAKDMQAGDASELLVQVVKAALGAGSIFQPGAAPAPVQSMRQQFFSALLTDTEFRAEVMDFIRNLAGGGALPPKTPALAVPGE